MLIYIIKIWNHYFFLLILKKESHKYAIGMVQLFEYDKNEKIIRYRIESLIQPRMCTISFIGYFLYKLWNERAKRYKRLNVSILKCWSLIALMALCQLIDQVPLYQLY